MYKDDNITVCDNYSSVIVISFVLMMTPSAFGSRRNVDVEKPKLPLSFCLTI